MPKVTSISKSLSFFNLSGFENSGHTSLGHMASLPGAFVLDVKQLPHLLQFLFQPGGGSALLKFLLDLWRAQVKSDLANRGL